MACSLVALSTLDSARFRRRIGRCSFDDPGKLQALRDQCAALALDVVFVRVPVNAIAATQSLLQQGALLADTLVYFAVATANSVPRTDQDGLTFRLAQAADVAAVERIAAACFRRYVGHYHADPQFAQADCDALYVDWAVRSVTTPGVAEAVLLAQLPDIGVVGFTTLRRTGDVELDIALTAVSPSCQGRGINRQLLLEARRLSQARNASRLTISTQINNLPSQRGCVHAGFLPDSAWYTLHWWLPNR